MALWVSAKELEDALADSFWLELKDKVLAVIEPEFRVIFDAGVAFARTIEVPGHGAELTATKDFLDPDPTALDDEAGRVFRTYMNSWWEGLSSRTRRRLRDTITRAALEGHPVDWVTAQLEPLFGPGRARRIAVTETTRLFGQGAQATYRASGVRGWRWLTVEDPRVCITCGNLSGTEYDMAVEFNPAHVSCRCFPSPII